mmetsp:Transcript_26452/g.58151  ORF Transcript_26452/g.58151 Transcript_26452/m.58151 type:complete len:373 (+) Transcript_26452:41-1159(+)
MAMRRSQAMAGLLIVCTALLTEAAGLRAAPVLISSGKVAVSVPDASKADVDQLRSKLEKVAEGFEHLLNPGSELHNTHVAHQVEDFATALSSTLEKSKRDADVRRVMKHLKDASAGVASLMHDLTGQMMRQMKERDSQVNTLLLGILMSKQHASKEEQMSILKNQAFRNLAAVKAVLADHDSATPLLQQVATRLDAQSNAPLAVHNQTSGNHSGPDMSRILQALNLRISNLEEGAAHRRKLHESEMESYDAAINRTSNSTRMVKLIRRRRKAAEREFMRLDSLTQHDLKGMKEAVKAIQNGDIAAVTRIQKALQESLQAMQAQSGGFLHLIQLGHRVAQLDCPYCAAQCVDACHSAGNAFTVCLGKCADAGK